MENNESKNGMKRISNKIILKNLSKKQKEVLTTTGIIGGGVGLGTGLFALYSMKSPEIVPEIAKAETNSLSIEPLDAGLMNSIEIKSIKPITQIDDHEVSFGEAFKVAREICGPGGWFIWKGKMFNTFYKEEWGDLSKSEKNDYLASIEIRDVQNIPENLEPQANKENLIASAEEIEGSHEPVNQISDNEFTVDFNPTVVDNSQQLSENATDLSSDLVQGEIIVLDDDSDILDNDYFELPDDIEITAISEEESSLIDNLTFDSSEVTTFPWETSEDSTATESLISEQEIVPGDAAEELVEHVSSDVVDEDEENPWGERDIKHVDNQKDIADQAILNQEEAANIISNPEEITEYPWGEAIEESEISKTEITTETVIGEINEETAQNDSDTFSEIEEFPWGDKNENFDPTIDKQISDNVFEVIDQNEEKENIGVILPEEPENQVLSKLPPSFDDITEFPWGETVPHSTVNPHDMPDDDLLGNISGHHEPNDGN